MSRGFRSFNRDNVAATAMILTPFVFLTYRSIAEREAAKGASLSWLTHFLMFIVAAVAASIVLALGWVLLAAAAWLIEQAIPLVQRLLAERKR